MWDFIRRWHPVILLLLGIYLAIPKPDPDPAEIDDEFVKEYDKNGDGDVDKTEFTGFDFASRDKNNDGLLTTGDNFKWPLHAFKMNLGQDLKGGSSLRYQLIQQDMADAENSLRQMVQPLADSLEKLPAGTRSKFEDFIKGGELRLGEFDVRDAEDKESADDFSGLQAPGLFDEGRVDAARRFYRSWNDARQRKEDKNLVGPTIETLNRRLGTSGITELNIAPLGDDRLEVKLPKFSTSAETQRFKDLLQTTGKLEMRVLAAEDGGFKDLQVHEYPRDEGYKYRWLQLDNDKSTASALAKDKDGHKWVPVMIIDEYDISGKDLADIQPTMDQQGQMAVSFSLKGRSVARFELLTDRHREAGEDPRLLAVIIDDKVYSAYTIKDKISGNVQLSGRFTAKERDDVINVLKSGSLNVRLKLEGEESVGPSEGAEAVQRGIISFAIAAIFVFAFALWLYRGLGVLVIFNLLNIVVLLLGAMALGLGTLTLPGIAGLVLTFGMAIDGNILINERMREELKRGLGMRGAAEEGFKNALPAILDSNITTLLTALILYKIGSGPVQGFALAVAIGIVCTLYCNVPAYRAMVMGVLNIRKETRFNMADLSWLENRNLNFVKGMKILVPVGALVAIIGFIMLFTVGSEVLGMEFRGGHTFRIQMSEAQSRDDIEATLMDPATGKAKVDWIESVEVQPVFSLGGAPADGKATRFDTRFPMRTEWEGRDQNDVNNELRKHLEEVFKDKIATQGWKPRATDIREVVLSASMTLKLRDAAAFREAHPDDMDKLWLIHDRSWNRDPNAPSTNKEKWFGPVVAGSTTATVVSDFGGTLASGDAQKYTLRIQGLTVTDAADLKRKSDEFQKAVAKYCWPEGSVVALSGQPEFREIPTKAKPVVDLTFVKPVKAADMNDFARDLASSNDALSGISFTAQVIGDRGASREESHSFSLVGSETTFSSDPKARTHFDSVTAAINDSLTKWLKTAKPEDNELSNPFLLASAIGPTVAGETQVRALLAILAALVVIAIYVRLRFASVVWGLAAIAALTFTVLVTLGVLGFADIMGADMKIDLVVVAAILTVIGYAINDTIVNFDRIRESLRKDRLATGGKTPLREIINQSANLMLPRTMMTGGTTLTSTLIMVFLGGPLLQAFAFTIFVGVILGTFASVFIASPVLLLFEKRGRETLMDLTEEEQQEDKAEGSLGEPAPEGGQTVEPAAGGDSPKPPADEQAGDAEKK